MDVQRANIKVAAQSLAPVAQQHQLVLAHGNGPQWVCCAAGFAYKDVEAVSTGCAGSANRGMIGYMIEQELATCCHSRCRLPPS